MNKSCVARKPTSPAGNAMRPAARDESRGHHGAAPATAASTSARPAKANRSAYGAVPPSPTRPEMTLTTPMTPPTAANSFAMITASLSRLSRVASVAEDTDDGAAQSRRVRSDRARGPPGDDLRLHRGRRRGRAERRGEPRGVRAAGPPQPRARRRDDARSPDAAARARPLASDPARADGAPSPGSPRGRGRDRARGRRGGGPLHRLDRDEHPARRDPEGRAAGAALVPALSPGRARGVRGAHPARGRDRAPRDRPHRRRAAARPARARSAKYLPAAGGHRDGPRVRAGLGAAERRSLAGGG